MTEFDLVPYDLTPDGMHRFLAKNSDSFQLPISPFDLYDLQSKAEKVVPFSEEWIKAVRDMRKAEIYSVIVATSVSEDENERIEALMRLTAETETFCRAAITKNNYQIPIDPEPDLADDSSRSTRRQTMYTRLDKMDNGRTLTEIGEVIRKSGVYFGEPIFQGAQAGYEIWTLSEKLFIPISEDAAEEIKESKRRILVGKVLKGAVALVLAGFLAACGGDNDYIPPTVTLSAIGTNTPTPTLTPSSTLTPTDTHTPVPTDTPTSTPTNTLTSTPTFTPSHTHTPSITPTLTPTNDVFTYPELLYTEERWIPIPMPRLEELILENPTLTITDENLQNVAGTTETYTGAQIYFATLLELHKISQGKGNWDKFNYLYNSAWTLIHYEVPSTLDRSQFPQSYYEVMAEAFGYWPDDVRGRSILNETEFEFLMDDMGTVWKSLATGEFHNTNGYVQVSISGLSDDEESIIFDSDDELNPEEWIDILNNLHFEDEDDLLIGGAEEGSGDISEYSAPYTTYDYETGGIDSSDSDTLGGQETEIKIIYRFPNRPRIQAREVLSNFILKIYKSAPYTEIRPEPTLPSVGYTEVPDVIPTNDGTPTDVPIVTTPTDVRIISTPTDVQIISTPTDAAPVNTPTDAAPAATATNALPAATSTDAAP